MDDLRELDARCAELLDINLTPPREYAMARVALKYIVCTGRVFELTTGDRLPMPEGGNLRQPEGSDNWNDRYMLYVAEFLGDRIKDEVDGYRYEVRHYSTDPAACAELDGEARKEGYTLYLWYDRHGVWVACYLREGEQPNWLIWEFGDTEWEARTKTFIAAKERQAKADAR